MNRKNIAQKKEWYSFLTDRSNEILDSRFIYFLFSIIIIGLIALFSGSSVTSFKLTDDPYYFFKKQVILFSISMIGFLITVNIPYLYYKKYSVHLIIFSILLLILVFIPGIAKTVKTTTGRNFHRWIGFGIFQLQPSEVAKLTLLVYLSAYLVDFEKNSSYVFPAIYISSILGLIIFEPALGTTIQLISIILCLIFLYGFPIKKLFYAFLSVIPILGLLVWKVTYWRKRIDVWLNPYSEKDGDGFQLYSSFRAFMEAGWFGNPLSTSHSHKSLPYNHTDFILATFVQDYGYIGFLLLLFVFLLILIRGYILILSIKEPFGFLLGSGIILMLGIQTIINLYVVTGLFPVTGISLPFISYGGSSLFMLMCAFGIFMNITKKENHFE